MHNPSHLPCAEEIVSYLSQSTEPVSKKDLCQHFGIKGRENRQMMKILLKDMTDQKLILKAKGKAFCLPLKTEIPNVFTVEITGFDDEHFVYTAKPEKKEYALKTDIWIKEKELKNGRKGDIFLIQLTRKMKTAVFAKPLKKIERLPEQMVGLVQIRKGGIAIVPTNRRIKKQFFLNTQMMSTYDLSFHEDDLVVFETTEEDGFKITQHLGSGLDPRNISLIAIHEHDIPHHFPDAVISESEKAQMPRIGKRSDFRHYPFVTIDGDDARDFDDAVYVEPVAENKGWRIFVAIADVAYYVQANSPLDKEALKRGNSVYFPDRVVPMLPEFLSNGLCSLNPDEDRACMVAEMIINEFGALQSKKIHRGLMRSKARLTYRQVENYITGMDEPALGSVQNEIDKLLSVYKILRKAREERGALDIHSLEQKVIFDDNLHIKEVTIREQLTSNQIIEELMVLANVAMGQLLSEKQFPAIYRVHEDPPNEKLETLRQFIQGFGYKMPVLDHIQSKQLNNIIKESQERPESFAINETVLRSQSQAYYSPDNKGHFGLALKHYAHFTSPIRRYADLIVHRALIRLFNLHEEEQDDGLSEEQSARLFSIAEQISLTERTAAKAERQTISRLGALFLASQKEKVFEAQISGVSDFGIFVRIPQFGSEGLIPMRYLTSDYYTLEESSQSLVGRRTGRRYQFLAPIKVRLVEVNPLLDSIVFEAAENKDAVLDCFHFKIPKSQFDNRKPQKNKKSFKKKYKKNGKSGKSNKKS